MNGRRYYVVNQTGESGPFTREELREALDRGSVLIHDQVRSAMGTSMGTVEETLAKGSDAAPEVVSASSTDLRAIGGLQWMPILVLIGALLPALGLLLLFRTSNNTSPVGPPAISPTQREQRTVEPPAPTMSPTAPPVTVPQPVPAAPAQPTVTSKPPPAPTPVATPPPSAGQVMPQSTDGTFMLGAEYAVVTPGIEAVLSTRYPQGPSIGAWRNIKDRAHWNLTLRTSGKFRVIARYGCPVADAGSEFTVTVAGNSLKAKVNGTPGWELYREFDLGVIAIPRPGDHQVVVQPTMKTRKAVMNLNRLVLKPE